MNSKKVLDSRTEQIQIVMPEHINGNDRLFGGQLVEWIDVVAAVVARRHSNCTVTTVSIDNLHFKAAAHVDNTIVLIGQITYVGMTSMEVRVDTFVEQLSGVKNLVNRAYLTLVALDEKERPCIVPRLTLETDEEHAEWEAGMKRVALRKQRRIEQF
ncbi:acyl-CoA thioesterase [Oscillospiraceae bacterium PP1C4]